MCKMYLYSYFMLLMFIIWLGMALIIYLVKLDLVIEWLIYNFNSCEIEIYLLIDWVSCLFVSVVLGISSMVLIYSISYMGAQNNSGDTDRFTSLVGLFVISMLLMIVSPSLFSILFGWDMLGLVSYCLVIYYQNMSSYNSGMVTVLSNRVGDVGLLLAIGLTVSSGSWNMYLLGSNWSLILMIMLAAITKSAQMPFSSWLPLAMAAPTPVSSLVHSSTLVTAGVYLMIRFNSLVMESELNFFLLLVSVLTMFMSGLMANFEFDLKKIIALSTLSQLGLMMMVLGLGSALLGFYHLLTHAIFKSLLFLCAGAFIHNMGDNQDIRRCGGQTMYLPFVSMSFYISIISLMGFPFLSGFYSKDTIIEYVYSNNLSVFVLAMIIFSVTLTVLYSIRLCYYMGFSSVKLIGDLIYSESDYMNFSMMILMAGSVTGGALLNWCFFLDLNMIYLSVGMKLMIVGAMMLGLILWGAFMFKAVCLCLAIKYLFLFNSSMWFMMFLHSGASKISLMFSSQVNLSDLIWIETISGSWMNFKMIMGDMMNMQFKIHKVIVFIVLLVVAVIIVM